MVYRKGERPVPRPLDRWSPEHPVADAIATGTSWLDAWVAQKGPHLGRLAQITGIPGTRLWTLTEGGPISRAELDALARAWSIPAAELAASLPPDMPVID